MKILQIANKIPYPPKDGGAIGIHFFTEMFLQRGYEVHVLAMNPSRQYVQPEEIDEAYRKQVHFVSVTVDTGIKPLDALTNLFTEESYNVVRFVNEEFRNALIGILKAQTFDIIQLESIFVAPYLETIRQYSKAKVVLRAHNIEHTIWERLAGSSSKPIKKWYLKLLAKRLKKFELDKLNQYDGILSITKEEIAKMQQMGCTVPVALIPFGVDFSRYDKPSEVKADKTSVFSLAAMDWQPNIEGIKWFLDNVWMKVLQQEPEAVFHLAGRNMPDEFYKLTMPNLQVHGEVPDAIGFMQANHIMVAPLLAGGGMRVKIVEGMALGKPIVSTTIGAEGVACTNGRDIMLADSAEGFATAIVSLLRDSVLASNISKEAKTLASNIYSTNAIGDKLEQFYTSLINQK